MAREAGLDGYSPTLRLLPSRFLLLHFLLLLTSPLESPNSPIDMQRTYLQTRLPQHHLSPPQSPLGITKGHSLGLGGRIDRAILPSASLESSPRRIVLFMVFLFPEVPVLSISGITSS